MLLLILLRVVVWVCGLVQRERAGDGGPLVGESFGVKAKQEVGFCRLNMFVETMYVYLSSVSFFHWKQTQMLMVYKTPCDARSHAFYAFYATKQ
jgi:hypothetical protein